MAQGEQRRSFRRRARVALGLALLSVILLHGSTGTAVGAQAAVSFTFDLIPGSGTSFTVCLGESTTMSFKILRLVSRGSSGSASWLSGAQVLGSVANPSVGHLDGTLQPTTGGVPAYATFTFVGDGRGQTDIVFSIEATGQEAVIGSGWPQTDVQVFVEVADCYEANTSSLASVFTTKDMGGLKDPFLLAGHTRNRPNLTTDTQVLFFIPNPQDRMRGGVALVDLETLLLTPRTDCQLYFSGRYQVIFYIPPSQAPPPGADVGDLLLFGQGTFICKGKVVASIDYGSTEAFRISFKPKGGR